MVSCPLNSYQLCRRRLARRRCEELRKVFVSTQGKADPGFRKPGWVVHSGCGHGKIVCRATGFRGVGSPSGALSRSNCSGWLGSPAGNSDDTALTCLSLAVTFLFPRLYFGSCFNENTFGYDIVTHFLSYKNFIATLFPRVPLISFFPFLP